LNDERFGSWASECDTDEEKRKYPEASDVEKNGDLGMDSGLRGVKVSI
jgi:hypothetical protein